MSLLRRNLPLLPAAFVLSAVVNIVPQGLLIRHEVAEREQVLAWLLLLGTAAAMAGVRLARAQQGRHGLAVAAGVLLSGGALAGMLGSGSVWVWAGLGLLARFAGNWTTQYVDRAAVAHAGDERSDNDAAGMSLRLLGTALPLVVFGMLWEGPWPMVALGAVLGLGLWGAPTVRGVAEVEEEGRLTGGDRRLLAHGGLMFAALSVFAVELAFLLDHLGIEAATAWAGGLLLLAHAVAVPTLLLLRSRPPPRLLFPALVMAGSVLPMQLGIRPGPAGLMASAALVGLGYGLFLAGLRFRVSAAEAKGRPVLAAYNDLANVSGLLAFGLLAALAWLGAHGLDFYAAVPLTVQALALGSLLPLRRWPPPPQDTPRRARSTSRQSGGSAWGQTSRANSPLRPRSKELAPRLFA